MNPADNLGLALALSRRIKGLPEEAGLRCACGRAYYAVFTLARDALTAANLVVATDGTAHKRVPSLLKQSGDTGIRTAAGLLDQLRTTRNSADYEVGSVPVRGQPFTATRASTAVVLANTIANEIDRVRKTDKRLGIPATVS